MIIGLSVQTFTLVHVIITLIAIATGLVVLLGMLGSHRLSGWTAIFLLTTVLTSVTGFMFPIHGFTPALGVGVISMVLLAIALFALYLKRLAGGWRWIYVATAVTALWFNIFVLIVQSFEKVKLLNPMAPQEGPPFPEPVNTHFVIVQAAGLIIIFGLGLIAIFKFRPGVRLSA
jgi:phosphoglycerol transferase MdoB-like AlkP superfamily enzyme